MFQQGVLGHLTERLGEGAHYWDASMGKQPLAGISERPPTPDRPYTVLSTVGMSCQRMPVVERLVQEPGQYARIELAMATTMAPALAARVFLWLASYPWRAVTWFGPGHSVRWYHEPATFPLGEGHEAVLLLDEPGGLRRPGGAGPVRLLVRRRPGALAVGHAHHRAGTAGGQGAGLVQPHHPAGVATPGLDSGGRGGGVTPWAMAGWLRGARLLWDEVLN